MLSSVSKEKNSSSVVAHETISLLNTQVEKLQLEIQSLKKTAMKTSPTSESIEPDERGIADNLKQNIPKVVENKENTASVKTTPPENETETPKSDILESETAFSLNEID